MTPSEPGKSGTDTSLSAGLRGVEWRPFGAAIGVGVIGGFVFSRFGLPLAWMLGAMVATTIASLAGVRMNVPNRFRTLFVAILGIMLGSAFTPEIIDQAAQWAGALAIQATYVTFATGLSYTIYLRIGGYDRVTAYFSSTPGGISEMVLLGESLGGDIRTMSLNHAVRVLIIMGVIPIYFRLVAGASLPSAPATGAISDLALLDFLILAACGVVGYLVAARLRLPAYAIIGPLLLSAAAIHLTGLTASSVPSPIAGTGRACGNEPDCTCPRSRYGFCHHHALFTGRLGRGAGAACLSRSRFAGISRVAWLAAITSTILIGSAVGVATLASQILDINASTLFLALAPGGLAEMSLIALALGVDTAFVTIMHFYSARTGRLGRGAGAACLSSRALFRAAPLRGHRRGIKPSQGVGPVPGNA